MLDLRKFLFRGDNLPADLDPALARALERWRALQPPDLDQVHFHSRYVVVDVATAGLDSDQDALLGMAAVAVVRGGVLLPSEVLAVDFSGSPESSAVDRQLVAFLEFVGKAPLVTYRVAAAESFLHRIFDEHLRLDFTPVWVDLAWLLPEFFGERVDSTLTRESWYTRFGIEAPPSHEPMANALGLARLLQVLLPKAVERGADTARRLANSGHARRFFRPGA